MRKLGLLSCLGLLLGVSCMSPRLGFPVKEIKTPVEVVLFTAVAPKGSIYMKAGAMVAESWKLLYGKKFEDEIFEKVDRYLYTIKLTQALQDYVFTAKDLFSIQSPDPLNYTIQYSKAKDDTSKFSGYDFSVHKDTIPTKYILALTIDEWGFIYSPRKEDSGPYMVFAIRLIDKDTNNSVWEYKEMFSEPILTALKDTDSGNLTLGDFNDVYERLIKKAPKRFFYYLNKE